jgi:hypothetical protein
MRHRFWKELVINVILFAAIISITGLIWSSAHNYRARETLTRANVLAELSGAEIKVELPQNMERIADHLLWRAHQAFATNIPNPEEWYLAILKHDELSSVSAITYLLRKKPNIITRAVGGDTSPADEYFDLYLRTFGWRWWPHKTIMWGISIMALFMAIYFAYEKSMEYHMQIRDDLEAKIAKLTPPDPEEEAEDEEDTKPE